MRIWIDECLSPQLVARACARGYWATCNRDRGLLGAADAFLHPIVIEEECVFVTSNEVDFRRLCRTVDLHTGLILLPQASTRAEQAALFDAAIAYIQRLAREARESPADLMLNLVIEVHGDGQGTHEDLPLS
jgi:predicted nuclease of predicted toxin-antitoxin system